MFDWLSPVFQFFNSAQIHGISITSMIIVVLVLSALGFLIRGNKS